jgi:acyl-CoA-binding protein
LEASLEPPLRAACYDRPPFHRIAFCREDFMSSLDERFEQAQIDVKALPEKPGNMTLLRLYALFKQATQGDAQGEKPGFADVVGKYKYEAWASLSGTAQDEAKERYVELVESLKRGGAA